MKTEDVVRMAKEAGVIPQETNIAYMQGDFPQRLESFAALVRAEALAEQALQNLSDFHQHMEETYPEYYDCGGTIGVVHKSQCSAAMKRNGEPLPKGFRPHSERMAELEGNADKKKAIDAARQRLVDKALSKICEIGTIDAMKWLHQATLDEAAKVCDDIEEDRWNQYKGRPPYTGAESGKADPHEQGVSMGAGKCAAAIRGLK